MPAYAYLDGMTVHFPFQNTYAALPDGFFARVAPTPVTAPRLIKLNRPLAVRLGLDPDLLESPEGAEILAGKRLPDGAEPIAMAYAGHQFGYFVPQLGDGRAILLGEVIDIDGIRRDIQLKGSGPTPFSRRGDGRAALGPVLREYLVSEAMTALGVPSTRALAAIPFSRNSNDFHFDTEIIIQLLVARLKIKELPIPTYYGDEICYVNGMKYAFNVIVAALKARMQEAGLFYDRKFDCAPGDALPYVPKFTYPSPHVLAFERIRPGTRVLDIGCAGGYMGAYLSQQKRCRVHGIDAFPIAQPGFDEE